MIIGTTLHIGQNVFTEWFPRPALNAFFAVQLIGTSGSQIDLEFQVFHKDRDEEGPGTALGATETIDGSMYVLPEVISIKREGMKELVRLRFKTIGDADYREWARFQLLNPSAYESAN